MALVIMAAISSESYFFIFKFCYIIIICMQATVFTQWNGESDGDNRPTLNLAEAGWFTKGMDCAVKIVESGWFRLSSQEISRGVPFAQLSLGDIVSLRRMHISNRKKQDLFSYSCLAILKSYFSGLKGILSYSFFDSLDATWMIGLGVWASVESAYFLKNNPKSNPTLPFWKDLGAKKFKCVLLSIASLLLTLKNNPKSNPALPFWKDLGAKKFKYDVCQVVYVTYQTPCLQNSSSSFQI